METQKKNYVLPIAMMFALFAMISFVTGLQNPMGIIVKNQFGASNFMSQLGNAANFIAYAFMGLPAGLMLQRIGYKKTALAAVAVGFIGVGISYLSGLMSSFSVYLIGAFVSGFSIRWSPPCSIRWAAAATVATSSCSSAVRSTRWPPRSFRCW